MILQKPETTHEHKHPLIFKTSMPKVIQVPERQIAVKELLVEEHLHGVLACVYELTQYKNPLNCAPLAFAALATYESNHYNVQETQQRLLDSLRIEWELVLSMEGDCSTALLLKKLCPHTGWQCYRELMVTFESESWSLTPRSVEMCVAWAPRVTSSANVEDAFASMEDAVRRSGKSDLGSLTNLQAVHLRSVVHNMTGQEHQGHTVSLGAADFEGPEVRGLRAKLFQPTSFSGSVSIGDFLSYT